MKVLSRIPRRLAPRIAMVAMAATVAGGAAPMTARAVNLTDQTALGVLVQTPNVAAWTCLATISYVPPTATASTAVPGCTQGLSASASNVSITYTQEVVPHITQTNFCPGFSCAINVPSGLGVVDLTASIRWAANSTSQSWVLATTFPAVPLVTSGCAFGSQIATCRINGTAES
jgi:hypothetical protein